ncbi:hypothetical protein [Sphingomonas hengshuiensis]|uniref:Uncharacterized protein n=1 Tax=Sphingomonas hengshuiensis TaxID=1609977 RepID=A0A7U4J816_9SPHN|nr:hypothetical protein [Sphingomonas hengshuiensis]AJP71966.1 hypothetical protein TS85_09470 [Sphingomonas hengshuiensis]
MDPREMLVAIVIVVTIGSILRARYGRYDRRSRRDRTELPQQGSSAADLAENARLRDELRALRERVQVLERVVTDSETSSVRLDREIESLRDLK